MGQLGNDIGSELQAWLEKQNVFFVATAPLALDGHIHCSPKGLDTFRVISPRQCAYLDLTGSGAETIAHVRENGRIVLMFCAFEGSPRIVRLHGLAHVRVSGDSEFASLSECFPGNPGLRAIIDVQLTRVSTSCGFGVPLSFGQGPRSELLRFAEKKGPEGLRDYQQAKNRRSIDDLPALD